MLDKDFPLKTNKEVIDTGPSSYSEITGSQLRLLPWLESIKVYCILRVKVNVTITFTLTFIHCRNPFCSSSFISSVLQGDFLFKYKPSPGSVVLAPLEKSPSISSSDRSLFSPFTMSQKHFTEWWSWFCLHRVVEMFSLYSIPSEDFSMHSLKTYILAKLQRPTCAFSWEMTCVLPLLQNSSSNITLTTLKSTISIVFSDVLQLCFYWVLYEVCKQKMSCRKQQQWTICLDGGDGNAHIHWLEICPLFLNLSGRKMTGRLLSNTNCMQDTNAPYRTM